MDILEAMKTRNSVRKYKDQPISKEIIDELNAEITACNQEGGLHIQLVTNEPDAFGGFMAKYGKFTGVKNYIGLIGKKGDDLDERLGYYGERVALKAQQLGLNTCWVAMTYSKGKSKCKIDSGEKMVCVLSLGYGETSGVKHKSKAMDVLSSSVTPTPDWFKSGMEMAMLAPTATNQQKFIITLAGDEVTAKSTGGFYSKVDLGIVKLHFEIGAGKENFKWLN